MPSQSSSSPCPGVSLACLPLLPNAPLKGICGFCPARICQVIRSLSPYKVLGPDKIPNIVLIKCCDTLIDHLFFIFKAVFKLNTYHPCWLELITLVLRKIGKTSYDVAKSYRGLNIGTGLPTVLPKQVTWVWVQYWVLAHQGIL